jgi:hypothetical protein
MLADTRIPRIYTNGSGINAATAIALSTWTHLCYQWTGTDWLISINGRNDLTWTTPTLPATNNEPFYVGANKLNEYFWDGDIADVLIHTRALTLPEIQILANRSDPMLGGLILPPRRKFWTIKPSIISTTPTRRYYIVKGVGMQCSY